MDHLLAQLIAFASLCRPGWADGTSTAAFLSAMALGGLAVGVTHCGPMCGPFVLSQTVDRLAAIPVGRLCEFSRLRGGLLLPYHLGRLTTYMVLGALAGVMGGGLAALPWLAHSSAILLAISASLMIITSVVQLGAPGGWAARILVGPARSIAASSVSTRGFSLGMLLGLLPCGALYTALLAAGAAGRPLAGALAMMFFGFGTIPVLVGVGMFGHLAARRAGGKAPKWRKALLLANGIFLLLLAGAREF